MAPSRRTRRRRQQRSFQRHQLRLEGLEKRYALNAAPVLDDSASPTLGSILEDTVAPVGPAGTLVSDLIDAGGPLNNFSDVDGDQLGIAITDTNLQGGSLWYSLDDGTTWLDVGSVSDESPRLLAANEQTRVFFEPTLNLNGVVDDIITFKAWDQQSSNSLSTTTDTIRIEVVPADPWLQQIPLFADLGHNHLVLLEDNSAILAFDCLQEHFNPPNDSEPRTGRQAVFIKYNHIGEIEWQTEITTENNIDALFIQGMEKAPDGGIVIYGTCAKAQFPGHLQRIGDENSWGFFVAKLSNHGTFDWVVDVTCTQVHSYTDTQSGKDRNLLSVDDSGNIFVVEALSSEGNGTLEINGLQIYSAESERDILLFHFAPSGSLENVTNLGINALKDHANEINYDHWGIQQITATNNGDLILAGRTENTNLYYIASIDNTGSELNWIRQHTAYSSLYAGLEVQNDFLYVTGWLLLYPDEAHKFYNQYAPSNLSNPYQPAHGLAYQGDHYIAKFNASTGESYWLKEVPGEIVSFNVASNGIIGFKGNAFGDIQHSGFEYTTARTEDGSWGHESYRGVLDTEGNVQWIRWITDNHEYRKAHKKQIAVLNTGEMLFADYIHPSRGPAIVFDNTEFHNRDGILVVGRTTDSGTFDFRPGKVVAPRVTRNGSSVRIHWDAPADTSRLVTEYQIERRLDQTNWFPVNTLTPENNFFDYQLTSETFPVYFRIAAANTYGRGLWSEATSDPLPIWNQPLSDITVAEGHKQRSH